MEALTALKEDQSTPIPSLRDSSDGLYSSHPVIKNSSRSGISALLTDHNVSPPTLSHSQPPATSIYSQPTIPYTQPPASSFHWGSIPSSHSNHSSNYSLLNSGNSFSNGLKIALPARCILDVNTYYRLPSSLSEPRTLPAIDPALSACDYTYALPGLGPNATKYYYGACGTEYPSLDARSDTLGGYDNFAASGWILPPLRDTGLVYSSEDEGPGNDTREGFFSAQATALAETSAARFLVRLSLDPLRCPNADYFGPKTLLLKHSLDSEAPSSHQEVNALTETRVSGKSTQSSRPRSQIQVIAQANIDGELCSSPRSYQDEEFKDEWPSLVGDDISLDLTQGSLVPDPMDKHFEKWETADEFQSATADSGRLGRRQKTHCYSSIKLAANSLSASGADSRADRQARILITICFSTRASEMLSALCSTLRTRQRAPLFDLPRAFSTEFYRLRETCFKSIADLRKDNRYILRTKESRRAHQHCYSIKRAAPVPASNSLETALDATRQKSLAVRVGPKFHMSDQKYDRYYSRINIHDLSRILALDDCSIQLTRHIEYNVLEIFRCYVGYNLESQTWVRSNDLETRARLIEKLASFTRPFYPEITNFQLEVIVRRALYCRMQARLRRRRRILKSMSC